MPQEFFVKQNEYHYEIDILKKPIKISKPLYKLRLQFITNDFNKKISDIKKEVDGKEFIFDMTRKLNYNSYHKIIIEDSSIKNKNKVKSSLIRFIFMHIQQSDSEIHIKVLEKNMTDETRENYYYPSFVLDYIKTNNI